MRSAAPRIDPRSVDDLLYALVRRIPDLCPEWKDAVPPERAAALALADDPHDVGMALLKLAARMGEVVIEHLNRLPDKALLAFLDLVGVDLLPPHSARVPLTFSVAEKAPADGIVPKGTRVGVEKVDEVVFETEEDLVVTRASVVRAFSLNPTQDRYAELTALVGTSASPVSTVFQDVDDRPRWPLVDHSLYIGHADLFHVAAAANAPIALTLTATSQIGPVEWRYSTGTGWMPAEASPTTDGAVLLRVPGLMGAMVEGYDADGHPIRITNLWVRATTAAPLPADTAPPTVTAISARVDVRRTRLAPDLAFFNNAAVDLSKDFLPFGERPKFNDTFYVANADAFAKTGATVTLDVRLSVGAPPPDSTTIALAWEYWDGQAWSVLRLSADSTRALRENGQLTFTCPAVEPSIVNGRDSRWIRARIVGGDYGREAEYQQTTSDDLQRQLEAIESDAGRRAQIIATLTARGLVDTFRFIPATFRPPWLTALTVGYDYTRQVTSGFTVLTANDFVYRDVSATPSFRPFTRSAAAFAGLWLGLDFEARRPLPGTPVTLYVQVLEQRLAIAPAPASPSPPSRLPGIVWRYWNGTAWSRLPAEDETQNFAMAGRMRFIVPLDLMPRVLFGERLLWIGATVEDGGFASAPSLGGILLNSVWAHHGVTRRDDVLGSSNGAPSQSFGLHKTPVLEGEIIEVREPTLPSGVERRTIVAAEGPQAVREVRNDAGAIVQVWVRWHAVATFNLSGPGDRHYVIDRVRGLLLFGDGARGMIPPAGKDSIRAALYRSGGGRIGNQPAGKVKELKTAIPFIDRVVNYEPSVGGADRETLEQVIARGPRAVKTRGRAVTSEDFESLALEASRQVARVVCLPLTRMGSVGLIGDSPGWVTLIVVPDDPSEQPVPTPGLIRIVKEYVAACSMAAMAPQIDVIGPAYLPVVVEAAVIPQRIEEAKPVEKGVFENIRAFFQPLTGGPAAEGWEFGRGVYVSEVAAVILRTPGVDRLRSVSLRVADGPTQSVVDIPKNALPSSGPHIVTAVGD